MNNRLLIGFVCVVFILWFLLKESYVTKANIGDRFLTKENFTTKEQNHLRLILDRAKFEPIRINKIIEGLKKNLISESSFPNQLFGKSVAFVGNGDILKSQNLGHEIDQQSTVVRFNDFPRGKRKNKYTKDSGKRTDIVVINQTFIEKYTKYNTAQMIIAVDSSHPEVIYEYLSKHKTKIWVPLPSFQRTQMDRFYSTGYYAILLMKDLYTNVNLYGFGGNSHFFNDLEMYKAHPLLYEHMTYKIWALQGIVNNYG